MLNKIYQGALFKTVHINAFFPHLIIPNNFAHLCGNRVLMSYRDVKPDVSAIYTQKSTENHSAENWRKNQLSHGKTGEKPYGLSGKEIKTISALDADNSMFSCIIFPET